MLRFEYSSWTLVLCGCLLVPGFLGHHGWCWSLSVFVVGMLNAAVGWMLLQRVIDVVHVVTCVGAAFGWLCWSPLWMMGGVVGCCLIFHDGHDGCYVLVGASTG
jgi:hypothetical protein